MYFSEINYDNYIKHSSLLQTVDHNQYLNAYSFLKYLLLILCFNYLQTNS